MARSPCSPQRIAWRLVLATLIAAACDNPTVVRPDFAYDPTQLTGGQLYRWSTGARVRVFVEPMAAGGIELAGAVQRAVVSWNAVPQEREFTLDVVTNRDLADVIVYDMDELAIDPAWVGEAVYDLPGGEWRRIQRAHGYRHILVNGEETFTDGECTGATPGKLLRNGKG